MCDSHLGSVGEGYDRRALARFLVHDFRVQCWLAKHDDDDMKNSAWIRHREDPQTIYYIEFMDLPWNP